MFTEKLPPLSELEYGYFEKHAEKHWIENDKDLKAMYRHFSECDVNHSSWVQVSKIKILGKRENFTRLKKLEEHENLPKCTAKETGIDKIEQELHGLDK